ncbi:uncharacterized protein AMSG_08712 [Thecamonas trahens ATCC 50062]|uniref:Uncharacterized protein n=1 Tax=Thecamonas trahens ATCC 50062 TaxID=461836 RepID=A0A0L0DLU9_THETB|nr:hypothetical protein AMSG_08712 [Thecamonas trahens ATCC 50062]KNC53230.1 hypothetical protein AMSG_08712 [Thecamonas trahens ATCC 50062]|eukprot:XP_013754497.1 hypothetical protein AMSG_08712 [Thecamonas trahens ATCC 50062]
MGTANSLKNAKGMDGRLEVSVSDGGRVALLSVLEPPHGDEIEVLALLPVALHPNAPREHVLLVLYGSGACVLWDVPLGEVLAAAPVPVWMTPKVGKLGLAQGMHEGVLAAVLYSERGHVAVLSLPTLEHVVYSHVQPPDMVADGPWKAMAGLAAATGGATDVMLWASQRAVVALQHSLLASSGASEGQMGPVMLAELEIPDGLGEIVGVAAGPLGRALVVCSGGWLVASVGELEILALHHAPAAASGYVYSGGQWVDESSVVVFQVAGDAVELTLFSLASSPPTVVAVLSSTEDVPSSMVAAEGERARTFAVAVDPETMQLGLVLAPGTNGCSAGSGLPLLRWWPDASEASVCVTSALDTAYNESVPNGRSESERRLTASAGGYEYGVPAYVAWGFDDGSLSLDSMPPAQASGTATMPNSASHPGAVTALLGVDCSADVDSLVLLSGCIDGAVRVWQVDVDGRELTLEVTLRVHITPVLRLEEPPRHAAASLAVGRVAVSVARDGAVAVVAVDMATALFVLPALSSSDVGLVWRPSLDTLLVHDREAEMVHVWQLSTGSRERMIEGQLVPHVLAAATKENFAASARSQAPGSAFGDKSNFLARLAGRGMFDSQVFASWSRLRGVGAVSLFVRVRMIIHAFRTGISELAAMESEPEMHIEVPRALVERAVGRLAALARVLVLSLSPHMSSSPLLSDDGLGEGQSPRGSGLARFGRVPQLVGGEQCERVSAGPAHALLPALTVRRSGWPWRASGEFTARAAVTSAAVLRAFKWTTTVVEGGVVAGRVRRRVRAMVEYVTEVLPRELSQYAMPELAVLAAFYQDVNLDVQRAGRRVISSALLRTNESEVGELVASALATFEGRAATEPRWISAVFMLGILGTLYPSLLDGASACAVTTGLEELASSGPLLFRTTAVSLLGAVMLPWERFVKAGEVVRLTTRALQAASTGSRYQQACVETLMQVSVQVPDEFVVTLQRAVLSAGEDGGESGPYRVLCVQLLARAVYGSASVFEPWAGALVAMIMSLVSGTRSLQHKSLLAECTQLLRVLIHIYPHVDADAASDRVVAPSPESPRVMRVYAAQTGAKIVDVVDHDGPVTAVKFRPGTSGRMLVTLVISTGRLRIMEEVAPLFGGKKAKIRTGFLLEAAGVDFARTVPVNEILQAVRLGWSSGGNAIVVKALRGVEQAFDLPAHLVG